MDDTFVIHKEVNKQGFLQPINSVDPAIKFTVEDNKEDGSIPFLDTIVKPETYGTLSITVYRKPTHTYQNLQWDSHHHLSAKFSVIHTLSHRAKTVCSKPELLQQERDHLRKALTKCKYPKWALDKVEKRLNRSTSEVIDGVNNQGTTNAQAATNGVKTKGHIVIPYTQSLCKSIKKISGRYGIQTHFKGGSTHQEPPGLPQGQRPYGQPKWCHILVPMWWPRLWWWIHRGNLQDLWWKIQGTPEGPLSYWSPQQPYRPPH